MFSWKGKKQARGWVMVMIMAGGCLCLRTPAGSQADGPLLLVPDDFRGGEVSAPSGEKWLALVPSEKGFVLEEIRIEIKSIRNGEGENAPPLKEVGAKGNHKPLFMVRGVPGLGPGPVETAASTALDLPIDRPIRWTLENGQTYELVVACDDRVPETSDHFKTCALMLSTGSKSQRIQDFDVFVPPGKKPEFASEARPSIIWAGDLDRDGALDLFLDLSNHYNMSVPTLLLSSGAPDHDLVRMAAQFWDFGS